MKPFKSIRLAYIEDINSTFKEDQKKLISGVIWAPLYVAADEENSWNDDYEMQSRNEFEINFTISYGADIKDIRKKIAECLPDFSYDDYSYPNNTSTVSIFFKKEHLIETEEDLIPDIENIIQKLSKYFEFDKIELDGEDQSAKFEGRIK